jgi:hypothetical protein
MVRSFMLAGVACLLALAQVSAQDKPATPDKETLHKQFTEQLSNAKLIGRFTFFGKEDEKPKEEEYTIKSVKKLDDGDYWLFNARIKYGERDVTIPMPLEVKWAGDTPVITLSDTNIPGLGTFSARVVIYRDTYAGWWQHGKVGGHLFGRVEKVKEEGKEEKK